MFFKLYLLTTAIFLAIDALWLTVIAKSFYSKQLGYLMSSSPNLLAAGLFYLLFTAGLVVFVLQPALAKNDWLQALALGAFFGLVCYATYDLTNLATIKQWPLLVTIIDLVWGATVSGITSTIAFFAAKKFFG